jgi:hypothetical protein
MLNIICFYVLCFWECSNILTLNSTHERGHIFVTVHCLSTTMTTTALEKTLQTMATAPPPTAVATVVIVILPERGAVLPLPSLRSLCATGPLAIGCAIAIVVRRPLLLLLLHHCRRRCHLTIDAGNAIASGGTGLAPPASAVVVAVIRRHRRVDRVEPLHPRHVGRGGNQNCSPLPPSPSPCRPVDVSVGVSSLPPSAPPPRITGPPLFRFRPPSPPPPPPPSSSSHSSFTATATT